MKNGVAHGCYILAVAVLSAQTVSFGLFAQTPSLEQRIAAIAQRQTENKAALVEYIWKQQETIKVKDKIEDKRLFQVQIDADGNTEKTPLDLPEEPSPMQQGNPGLRGWITQKKKHGLENYTEEMKQLAENYTQAGPSSLRSAYDRGDLALESAGADAMRLVVRNCVKPGDSVSLVFDSRSNQLRSLEASSWLTGKNETVQIHVGFSTLENGPDHVEQIIAESAKRRILVSIRNFEYQRR